MCNINPSKNSYFYNFYVIMSHLVDDPVNFSWSVERLPQAKQETVEYRVEISHHN